MYGRGVPESAGCSEAHLRPRSYGSLQWRNPDLAALAFLAVPFRLPRSQGWLDVEQSDWRIRAF